MKQENKIFLLYFDPLIPETKLIAMNSYNTFKKQIKPLYSLILLRIQMHLQHWYSLV
jgi:hypothetical protein